MKTILWTSYGSTKPFILAEIDQPVPKDQQVLVKVIASSVNAADYRGLTSPILARLIGGGLRKPSNTRSGSDLAGRVEAVGENVTRFKPGDEVFGCASGAFAEYVLAREAFLAPKLAGLSFEEAAAVPVGALTALQAIRFGGRLKPGQKALIQGASGGVGIFAVQLAKLAGAEVTAVCSPRNLAMARSLGADHVIDYTKKDFSENGQHYDLILGINGYHSIFAYQKALNPQGVYVCAGGTMPQIIQSFLLGKRLSNEGGKRLGNMGIAKVNQEDLLALAELLAAGKLRPVIDRIYPLERVPEAIRYIIEEHAQGKVVITVSPTREAQR